MSRCRDEGDRPGCLGVPDERFTMNFDDIGEKPIYFCAACGPEAMVLTEAIMKAFRDPGFEKRLEAEVERIERGMRN